VVVDGGERIPARPPERPPPVPAPARASAGEAREGRSIGAAAAELVSPGDALLLDGGPVSTWLVRALIRRRDLRRLTVCTNDLDVAAELRPAVPRFSVLVAGGAIGAGGGTLVGPLIGPALERIRADLCFLGCVGVDRAAGVTGADFEHGAVWQRYLRGAERTVLLAPGSAVGRRGQVTFAAVDELDLLVTGGTADDAAVRDLRDAGLEVRTVD
jgi:DeoR family transcriptional regulator, aga operon transcriptional repressor